jgi:MerR family transcriptional regulator, copper efflux regulator
MTIGTIAGRTGCSVPTVRYYEEIGLLPAAARKSGGHRVYGDADLNRLLFIRRCRDFGFSVEEVRALIALIDNPERDCAEARDVAETHLGRVRQKLGELKALETSLAGFVESCTAECAGGPAACCTILEDLSRPASPPRIRS